MKVLTTPLSWKGILRAPFKRLAECVRLYITSLLSNIKRFLCEFFAFNGEKVVHNPLGHVSRLYERRTKCGLNGVSIEDKYQNSKSGNKLASKETDAFIDNEFCLKNMHHYLSQVYSSSCCSGSSCWERRGWCNWYKHSSPHSGTDHSRSIHGYERHCLRSKLQCCCNWSLMCCLTLCTT